MEIEVWNRRATRENRKNDVFTSVVCGSDQDLPRYSCAWLQLGKITILRTDIPYLRRRPRIARIVVGTRRDETTFCARSSFDKTVNQQQWFDRRAFRRRDWTRTPTSRLIQYYQSRGHSGAVSCPMFYNHKKKERKDFFKCSACPSW